jgi:hypothetical protein
MLVHQGRMHDTCSAEHEQVTGALSYDQARSMLDLTMFVFVELNHPLSVTVCLFFCTEVWILD